MLDDLLALFAIVPDYDLDIMRPDQTLTEITTRVLAGMEPVLGGRQARRGAGARRHLDQHGRGRWRRSTRGIPVGHVEAGLRTTTIWEPYPEELNRRLTGRIASFHFAPTSRRPSEPRRRGRRPGRYLRHGQHRHRRVPLDAAGRTYAADPPEWAGLDPSKPWIFVTAHRRENHERIASICEALIEISRLPQRPRSCCPSTPRPKWRPSPTPCATGTRREARRADGLRRDRARDRPLAARAHRQRRSSRGSSLSGQAGPRHAARDRAARGHRGAGTLRAGGARTASTSWRRRRRLLATTDESPTRTWPKATAIRTGVAETPGADRGLAPWRACATARGPSGECCRGGGFARSLKPEKREGAMSEARFERSYHERKRPMALGSGGASPFLGLALAPSSAGLPSRAMGGSSPARPAASSEARSSRCSANEGLPATRSARHAVLRLKQYRPG